MQMDFVQVVGWGLSVLGVVVTVVMALLKLMLGQFEKRQGERFTEQERQLEKIIQRQDKDHNAVMQLERDFLKFQADLAVKYVRREDWAHGQSVIEAKLDGLALKFENLLLKGTPHD